MGELLAAFLLAFSLVAAGFVLGLIHGAEYMKRRMTRGE